MRKAQASMEYILIISVLLAITIPLFYYATTKSSESIRISQGEDLVVSLAQAAEEVYALGPGSKIYVWAVVPSGVQGIDITGSEIALTLSIRGNASDIIAVARAPLTGDISNKRGTIRIPVEYLTSGVVLIGEGNDTTAPSIVWKSPENQACNPVTLRITTDESAQCKFDTANLSYDAMSTIMEGNALGHNYELGIQNEGAYTYYFLCKDAFENSMNDAVMLNYALNFTSCAVSQETEEEMNETDPPIVTLVNPESGYTANTSKIDFFYTASDASPLLSCSLIIDNSSETTVLQPERESTNNLTGNLDLGTYVWSVSCIDFYGAVGKSGERVIIVNASLDNDLPIVTVISPSNETLRNFNYVQFFYNVTDLTSMIDSCSISIFSQLSDDTTVGQMVTDFSVTEAVEQSVGLTLEKGTHTWNVSCVDDSIYMNKGVSESFVVIINTTTEQSLISTCAGYCGFSGYTNGVCRQESTKCTQNNEKYLGGGDQYCTGGSQSDTCCCVP